MKTTLLIFGVTGDLAKRKLLPALQAILDNNALDDELEVVGISRRAVTAEELVGVTSTLASRLSTFTMNVADPAEYTRLKQHIGEVKNRQVIAYLSVPPGASGQIIELLGKAGFNGPEVKLLLEKPFGMDLHSAIEMNERIGKYFSEEQIYRIDHYLAKEMAQNIIAFRRSNALFSHVWNNQAIEKIEVIASETIGIEGRAEFYEQTGALRDVIQGHLMQLLSLVLLTIDDSFSRETIPQLRLQALKSLLPALPEKAHRAQYEGYSDEAANPGSLIETYAEVMVYSDHENWKNVPMRLITGKVLDKKTTEINVYFRKFHDAQGDVLTLRIQPNEAVEMMFFAKKPGYDDQLEQRTMAFTYDSPQQLPDAYEQVLVDAIRSRKNLFPTSDEVVVSWGVLQPVLDSWEMDNSPLPTYPKGSPTHTIHRV